VPTIFLKPESVNMKTKAGARQPDAMVSIGERNDKKKFALPFFPPNEMAALFPVQRNNADDFRSGVRAPRCKHDGRRVGVINLYGCLRICILCTRAEGFDKNKNRE
jgi:hypothetical protein